MSSNIIVPDFVIKLNPDYTISNHGIHKRVCSYYRKGFFDSPQEGGFIRGGTIFPKNVRKYFTPSALRYLEKYNLTPNDILSAISNSYNPEYYNSNRINDLNEYIQIGGKQQNKVIDIDFQSDLSGEKADKRLVYLVSVLNKPVVIKISQAKSSYLKEKEIYRYFNHKSNSKSSKKYDSIIDKYVLKTYETKDYPEEYLDAPEPYILLPCKINNKNFKIKLSNNNVPVSNDNVRFINDDFYNFGLYNTLKDAYKTSSEQKYTNLCLYMIVENRPKFYPFKEYVNGEGDPDILKKLVFKTANILNYLNQLYGFSHWDLHYHNLLVYVEPKNKSKKRDVSICLFDFDLSAIGNGTYTNVEAYLGRLQRYLKSNYNLFEAYKRMLEESSPLSDPNISSYMKEVFELFESFLDHPSYTSYNLNDTINEKLNLEQYFKYMGRIHDIIRLVNNIYKPIDITIEDIHKNMKKSNITDENKTNIEVIIIYNLMQYMNLKSHRRMAFASIMYTDFLLYLRKHKVLRKSILKL